MTDRGLTRAQARQVDRVAIEEFGVPGVVLMENAGRGAAEAMLPEVSRGPGPVAILCGGGNNGGDGYVVARHLHCMQVSVRVFATHGPQRLRGDAAVMRAIVDRGGPQVSSIETAQDLAAAASYWSTASVFVDALLGTGFEGTPRPHLAAVLLAVEQERARSGALVIALDLPSGLDADSGQPARPTLRADRTLTFVAPKRGFSTAGAAAWTGAVQVLPIGAPAGVLERVLEQGE